VAVVAVSAQVQPQVQVVQEVVVQQVLALPTVQQELQTLEVVEVELQAELLAQVVQVSLFFDTHKNIL
jgi:hypothetical protein